MREESDPSPSTSASLESCHCLHVMTSRTEGRWILALGKDHRTAQSPAVSAERGHVHPVLRFLLAHSYTPARTRMHMLTCTHSPLMHMLTCVHITVHTHNALTHVYTLTCFHVHMLACTHMLAHTCLPACAHMHMLTHPNAHMCMQTRAHAHMYALVHMFTHAHTDAHMRKLSHVLVHTHS